MAVLNSQIIICKSVKLDRGHVNVLNYSTTQMLTMCNSSGIFVASRNNYSFIRKNGTISVDFTYSQCVQCNYMAFQNPDYDNKWFFAWIDDIEYKGDRNVEIKFTVDQWATWFDEITWLPVMVEREHVNSDVWNENLEPEPFNGNLFTTNYTNKEYFTDFSIVVFFAKENLTSSDYGFSVNGRYCTPIQAFRYDCTPTGIGDFIADMVAGSIFYPAGQLVNNNIMCVYVIPNDLIPPSALLAKNVGYITTVEKSVQMPVALNLDGYFPVNQKMFQFPYNYVSVDNGHVEKIYKYEKFDRQLPNPLFTMSGGIIPGGGVSLYPNDYDGKPGHNVVESLSISNFPMIAFPVDSFSAWLAQSSSSSVMNGVLSALQGAMSGFMVSESPIGAAVGAGVGVVSSAAKTLIESEVTQRKTENAVGGTNCTTLDMINGYMGFCISQKCLIANDAKKVDNYLSKYGYAINNVKIPNITGRSYWNFIKVNGIPIYGPMPENARDEITNICNQGVTIWHDHSYLGNYLIAGDSNGRLVNPIV